MLRQLTQRLRQNAYLLNGIRRLRRRVRKDIDDNWSCGDCGWRLTRKTYYKNCRCHLCEDWNGCGSTKTTKCFSYFCEVYNTEKSPTKAFEAFFQWSIPTQGTFTIQMWKCLNTMGRYCVLEYSYLSVIYINYKKCFLTIRFHFVGDHHEVSNL